jgi:hypothetical protein
MMYTFADIGAMPVPTPARQASESSGFLLGRWAGVDPSTE